MFLIKPRANIPFARGLALEKLDEKAVTNQTVQPSLFVDGKTLKGTIPQKSPYLRPEWSQKKK